METEKKVRSEAEDARLALERFVDHPGERINTTPEHVKKRQAKA